MLNFIKRRRPSPGTVLGMIALIVALAGTAIAGPLASKSTLDKQEKKQVRKLARGEINKAAPTLSVANAATAVNAGTVDGHDAVCPAGTFLRGGTCFDSTVRTPNTPWSGGATDCVNAGGRLPSIVELISIREVTGVNLGPDGDGTWSDVSFDDGGVERAASVGDDGDVEMDAVGGMHSVICAFELVR
jgi:hypothetical protein